MSLISGFNVTPSEVATLAQASLAAFSGGAIPSGWTVVTPQQLGIAPQYRDGIYFTNNGASAIVLQNGGEWIVSFRGTDFRADIEQYPQLISGNYIDHFQPLLAAVAAGAPAGTHFSLPEQVLAALRQTSSPTRGSRPEPSPEPTMWPSSLPSSRTQTAF